jgi:sulfite exporter TauE/SafE
MTSKMIAVDSLRSDPNFLWILVGGVVWLIGLYTLWIGPLLTTGGFILTCYATAATALNRPISNALPGLLMGGVLLLAGQVLAVLPLLGLIAPFFIVIGSVLILFFATPVAIQKGSAPLAEALQRVTKPAAKSKKQDKEEKEQ